MKKELIGAVGVALVLATQATAADRWEADLGEDSASTSNFIVPGAKQLHDLEFVVVADQDWMRVPRNSYHSFEAHVAASTFLWNIAGSCSSCPALDVVDGSATVLVAGAATVPGASVARWIDTPGGSADRFLRVTAPTGLLGVGTGYEVELTDTTYAVPRWNNNATQVTVYLIQNHGSSSVSGNVYFFSSTGTLLHTQPFTIPPRGLEVFNTAAISALTGLSGSAIIAHTGPANSLAGKATALEPATGFSFDTAFVSLANDAR